MSQERIIRLIGMIVFAIGGIYAGIGLASLLGTEIFTATQYAIAGGILGGIIGILITPSITIRPAQAIRRVVSHISAQALFAAVLGLIMGLLIAALLAFPLSLLPTPLGDVLPFVGVVLFGYLGVAVFVMREEDLFGVFGAIFHRSPSRSSDRSGDSHARRTEPDTRSILLDTSVIIDGRIADIARTGFLPGNLLIPRFVLNELQYIADSSDSLRRQRGRRGMEVLAQLQKDPHVTVRITDIDVEGIREVDDKLIILAQQMKCPILTNDYNLNRIAELQGVSILNVNELANAVKSVLLPGEVMEIRVIQEGKEHGQGVGYMEDGTMVVVENGREYMHQEIAVLVTKVLQTAAGRMIFARPEERLAER